MNRKEFIRLSCLTCIGGAIGMSLLQSCSSQNMVKGNLTDSGITIPLQSFLKNSKEPKSFKNYLVVTNPQLQNPICVFRLADGEYSAVLMKCTHQGAELQVFGDMLQCPAHGSEFNKKGEVVNGPARRTLRKFPVHTSENEIYITLT